MNTPENLTPCLRNGGEHVWMHAPASERWVEHWQCRWCPAETLIRPENDVSAEKIVTSKQQGPLWNTTFEVERLFHDVQASSADTFEINRKVLEGLIYDSLLWREDRAKEQRSDHETTAPHPMAKLTALESSVYGALKWLLSYDPLNAIHARDILLSAIGQTQEEFAHRWRDHIIQPPTSAEKATAKPLDAVRWICGECSTVNSNNDLHCCVKSCKGCRPFGWASSENGSLPQVKP